jgi:hypothetical protein
MCANPMGGSERLDRIDFMDFASGTDSPFKLLYLKVISDAVSDYLFFGLGKNGTVPDDFWYATEYFFTCRSYIEDTWSHAKFMRQAYVDETTGKRVSSTLMLSDEELKQTCFDRHYEIAELHKLMPIDRFLSWLRTRREEILTENQKQVNDYIDLLQRTALKSISAGTQIGFALDSADRMQVLIKPDSPEQVAELVLYAPRYRRSHRNLTRMNHQKERPIHNLPRSRYIEAPSGQFAFSLS